MGSQTISPLAPLVRNEQQAGGMQIIPHPRWGILIPDAKPVIKGSATEIVGGTRFPVPSTLFVAPHHPHIHNASHEQPASFAVGRGNADASLVLAIVAVDDCICFLVCRPVS